MRGGKRTSGVVARGHRGKGAQGVSPPKAPERQADLCKYTHVLPSHTNTREAVNSSLAGQPSHESQEDITWTRQEKKPVSPNDNI